MRVRVVMEQVVGHRLGDRPRHLRSTRRIEVRDRKPAMHALERGKLPADLRDHSGQWDERDVLSAVSSAMALISSKGAIGFCRHRS